MFKWTKRCLSKIPYMNTTENFNSIKHNETHARDDGSSSACSFGLLWLTQFVKGLFSATSAFCYHHSKSASSLWIPHGWNWLLMLPVILTRESLVSAVCIDTQQEFVLSSSHSCPKFLNFKEFLSSWLLELLRTLKALQHALKPNPLYPSLIHSASISQSLG